MEHFVEDFWLMSSDFIKGIFIDCYTNIDSSDIKNNAWVTVNNDFWVTSEAICQ